MDEKNKQANRFVPLLAAAIIIVVLLLLYYFFSNLSRPAITFNSGLGQFKTVSRETLTAIKGLKVCGNWPIVALSANPDRGDPFNKKNTATSSSVIVVSSSEECLPVSP